MLERVGVLSTKVDVDVQEEGLAVGMVVRVKIKMQPRPGKGLRLTLDLEGGKEPGELGDAVEMAYAQARACLLPGNVVGHESECE